MYTILAQKEEEEEEKESRKLEYPLDSKCYQFLDEIGQGVSAIVYKSIDRTNSTVVAIKSIDLDQSHANLDNVRREVKTMSLLSHSNIIRAHCSFTVGHHLWVVMPFMSAGCLQSIVSSSFPDGLSEHCIAVVLKEILSALSYLHDQGHLHKDIKAGNILIDSNGSVKLAGFGVSSSIYEEESLSSSSSMLTDHVEGTPYWIAPEVIHSDAGYSFKADIWSFGITALELAHGRPPLSHHPPSKSMIMKITNRIRVSDYERKSKDSKSKKFSKSFKNMIVLCLDQEHSKRPSAEKLLKHSFFKKCNKGSDFLIKNLLKGLPSLEQRFSETKLRRPTKSILLGENVKQRSISGWYFNVDDFKLHPVFERQVEEEIKKGVRFGGETIIRYKGYSGDSDEETQLGVGGEAENIGGGGGSGVDRKVILASLMMNLRKSLDEQRETVNKMIGLLSGKEIVEVNMSIEEKLVQEIENLKIELENKKKMSNAMMNEHFKLQDASCFDYEEVQRRKKSLMKEIEKLKIELENEKR